MSSSIISRALSNNFVLIAEIGVNYYDIATKNGISPMDAAKMMISNAKSVGIHAVKFQTYKAESLASKDSPFYWDITEEPTMSQFALFKKYDSFGQDEYEELSNYCNELKIEFLSTAFDIDSADYLDSMMNVYKISSSDLNNIPFIEYQAKKNKPILLSVGASDENEIDLAVFTIKKYNDKPIAILHCVLEYPTPYRNANLNKIVSLKKKYPDLIIGYSDHTKPDKNYDIVKTAYNLGAVIIEKHFTLDKSLPGNDHYHSMDPIDAKNIIEGLEFLESVRGSYEIKALSSESVARENARRSLVAACDIKKGTEINRNMLTFKRPGRGISPAEIDKIIGRKSNKDIHNDEIIKYDMFD